MARSRIRGSWGWPRRAASSKARRRQGAGVPVLAPTEGGEGSQQGHPPVLAGVDPSLRRRQQALLGQDGVAMPGLQGCFRQGDEVPRVLRLGLYPGQVLPGQGGMPDPVQQVGGVGQEVAGGRAPPGVLVQFGLAQVVKRGLGVIAVRGQHGQLPVRLGAEKVAVELVRHPEDLVRAGPADVVLAELGRHPGPKAHDVRPPPGPVRHQGQRLFEPVHGGGGVAAWELDRDGPVRSQRGHGRTHAQRPVQVGSPGEAFLGFGQRRLVPPAGAIEPPAQSLAQERGRRAAG